MRAITDSSWSSHSCRHAVRARVAGVVLVCVLAAACNQTPTAPSIAAVDAINAAVTTSSMVHAQGTSQTWQDFAARGWNCRTPNNGPVTVCSPPNQPLPTIAIPPAQPPADRPATVSLKRWRNELFDANVLLIRPEIYNGQSCQSTGQPYFYITVLGYFECAHTVGN